MIDFYFDNREGRMKPIPNCGEIGCIWNDETQRCERPGAGLRDLSPLFGGSDAGDFNWYGNTPGFADYYTGFNQGAGAGFAQSGSLSNDLPWDFSSVFDIALELGYDEELALLLAGGLLGDPTPYLGDRFDPIFTDAPAPLPATYPIDLVIPTPAGIPGPDPSIFAPDADDAGEVPRRPWPAMPGYCPGGTYHPSSDPYACVPYPQDAAARRRAQQAKAKQGRAQQQRAAQNQKPCSQGQARWPYSGQCVPTRCPAGTTRNPTTGACISSTPAQGLAIRQAAAACPQNRIFDTTTKRCVVPGELPGDSKNWLWLVLAGLALVVVARR